MVQIAYLDENTKNIIGKYKGELKTKDKFSAALNICGNLISENKSVLVLGNKTSTNRLYKEIVRLGLGDLCSYSNKIENISYDYTTKEFNYYFDNNRIKKLNDFYLEDCYLKDNASILQDNLFYQLHFDDIKLECINGLNHSYINDLYNHFEDYAEYFTNIDIFHNPFVYSNSVKTDIPNLKNVIQSLINFEIKDNFELNEIANIYKSILIEKKFSKIFTDSEFIRCKKINDEYYNEYNLDNSYRSYKYEKYCLKYNMKELDHLTYLIKEYQRELDYDDYFYKVDFITFRDYLKYQLENIDRVVEYNKLNEMFHYFNQIGASELITYVKKGNVDKLVSVLDRSIVNYETSLFKINDDYRKITFDLEKHIEADASKLCHLHFERIRVINNSLNFIIESRLSKFKENPKFNKTYLLYKPLILANHYKKNDYDVVVSLDGVYPKSDINIVEEIAAYMRNDSLAYLMDDLLAKNGIDCNYDTDKGLYLIDNDYYNLDLYLYDSTLYGLNKTIKAFSLIDLGIDYNKEISNIVKTEKAPKQLSFEKSHYQVKKIFFTEYCYYDKRFKSTNLDDLPKLVKKIIKKESAITKKELIKRIASVSDYKINKHFKECLTKILYEDKKLNKRQSHFYYEIDHFKIKDFYCLTDVFDVYLEEFLKIIIDNSYDLNLIELKRLIRNYLNCIIKKEDEKYLIEMLNKYRG